MLLCKVTLHLEHQNILTTINDQHLSIDLPSGSRQGRLLYYTQGI